MQEVSQRRETVLAFPPPAFGAEEIESVAETGTAALGCLQARLAGGR